MCYRVDYLAAIWALKSFYRKANVRYPLVIHLQGPVPARMWRRLAAHFPTARLVTQTEADTIVEPILERNGLRVLLAVRRANPMLMKLTDFVLIGDAIHVLSLDSDVLFFRRPEELLIASDGTRLQHELFMHDFASSYNVSPETAREDFGITLVPRINCGVMLYAREHVDLARCETLLARASVNRNTGLTEQTLRALLASERNRVAFLSDLYHLTLDPAPDLREAVMRHYAGPSRPLLAEEGIPMLRRSGFLREGS